MRMEGEMQATKAKSNYAYGFGRKGPDKERKGIFSRGPIGFVVIGAHVVLIWALLTSMGIIELPGLAKPMEAVIIDAPVEQKSEPVPIVKPDLEQPMIETPPIVDTIPEIEVPVDEPAPAAITAETSPAPPVQETANMTVSRRVDPVYPPGSRRDGEQGTGMYRVLVDEKGKPKDVQVLKSSGFPRLDEAAMAAIRKWAFKPAVQNSQPVQSWTRVQVAFRLENA
jgi:periplasmic protein TonB